MTRQKARTWVGQWGNCCPGMHAARRWLVLLCGCSLGLPSVTVAAEINPLPLIPVVASAPKIDGALSDECWQEGFVASLDGFCDATRRREGVRPRDPTEVRLICDAEHLYAAFRCGESCGEGPWIYRNDRLARRGNSHVLGGDHVAVAMDMGRYGFYNYYFFAVNPAGEVYRCFTWPHRYDLVLRDIALPDVVAAATVVEGGREWIVEMKIPLRPMLRYPTNGVPQVVGLDLRRVAYGADKNQPELDVYWTGMAAVTDNKVKPYYDHLATWRPLFENYPDFGSAYACGRGWIQLIFPESFGHVRLGCGTLQNKLIVGAGARLEGLIDTRMSWDATPARRKLVAAMFDVPRMEYWDDMRRSDWPRTEPRVVQQEDSP
ncbi:MAG: hypothetical protein N2255_07470, partial [Kiritimatiellae bacterium]|nr:hypothetical protein [Kiritimatiellia bacterium]